jgi:hypothetical protein
VLSARIVLTLLAEAQGVPVIFAILLPSGNVVLEVVYRLLAPNRCTDAVWM